MTVTESKQWVVSGLVPHLHIRMTSRELCEHLMSRATYHATRRDEKRAYLPQLKDATEKIKAQSPAATVAQFSKMGHSNYRFDGDDALESLERDIQTHNDKFVYFQFIANHLFEQDYCLSEDDLVKLEIMKRT